MEMSRAGEARSKGESCTTWSALSSEGTASICSKSPQEIMALFGPHLTNREKLELAAMQEVWYFALFNKSQGFNNDGYDDYERNYILFRHEHLRYRYEVLKKIGEGGQGQVIQCLDHKRNILVAIKILVSPSSSKQETYQKMELQIALELQDEGSDEDFNVIKVLNIFHFRGHYCIVMELLKESLHEVIRNAGLRRLDMAMVKTYTRGILKFLRHIHSRKIVHADIKPENVLVKDTVTGTVRITDFGTSFFVESQQYLAPELLLGYSLTCGVDMWALGCTVAELATGRELFRSNSHEDHLPRCIEILGMPPRYMVNGAPDRTQFFDHRGKMFCPGKKRVPGSFPLHRVLKSDDPEFVKFISSCLRWDPNCRMTPAQALAHNWLRTAATSTTTASKATTTTTAAAPGSVKRSGAAKRRVELAQRPTSLLAQASKEKLKVVEEETMVEELVVLEEEETLVEELVVLETLVEELVVQQETLVEELVVLEETLVEEMVVQETLVEELVVQEETLVEELVVQQETLVEELVVQEETLVEELVVQETLVEELVVQEETLVEELVVQQETLVEELVVQQETLVEELMVQETLVEELVVQEETLVEELVVQEETLVEELVVQEETLVEELVVQEETLVEELVVQKETLVEELVVQETLVEELVVQQEKRKQGSLARIGRAIRSLLRRVLLCGGRSTAQ
ncbi:dual specificity tyrosine-phosphorylation-regulated kinase 2-like isoform X2 [Lethenteron reissneri]|uniref:dual specificity tyrosine-phosphorylation-regulated kinase 2-like isoform X2 n=1 Tax=Lethenteron reissneri TaxID=7753 RepID=UPI002AB73230|nr:dual specificity tyrosine-phosphorylation-regulated kinase 2-like isoform X2 [Lethenteron reissneri]